MQNVVLVQLTLPSWLVSVVLVFGLGTMLQPVPFHSSISV